MGDEYIMSYTYRRLRDLRENHDLKQRQICEILMVSQRQYSRWETGRVEIPFHDIIVLAKFYNISIDCIAGITDIPKEFPKK